MKKKGIVLRKLNAKGLCLTILRDSMEGVDRMIAARKRRLYFGPGLHE